MKDFLLLCLCSGIGCFIGSRFVFILTQLPELLKNINAQNLFRVFMAGGFVFYGGLFGAYAGVWIYAHKKKIQSIILLDTVTPAFVLFHVFGRIGCFMAGCCYGFELENELVIGNVHFRCFPLQAVEVAVEAILFILLNKSILSRHKFCSYVTIYAVYRFIAEFFRGDAARGIWIGLSTSQWISVIVIVVATVLFIRKANRKSAAE